MLFTSSEARRLLLLDQSYKTSDLVKYGYVLPVYDRSSRGVWYVIPSLLVTGRLQFGYVNTQLRPVVARDERRLLRKHRPDLRILKPPLDGLLELPYPVELIAFNGLSLEPYEAFTIDTALRERGGRLVAMIENHLKIDPFVSTADIQRYGSVDKAIRRSSGVLSRAEIDDLLPPNTYPLLDEENRTMDITRVTLSEAAAICGVSRQAVHKWIAKGRIPAKKDPETGNLLVDVSSVDPDGDYEYLYRSNEIQRLLKLQPYHVMPMVDDGKLIRVKFGKSYRYTTPSLRDEGVLRIGYALRANAAGKVAHEMIERAFPDIVIIRDLKSHKWLSELLSDLDSRPRVELVIAEPSRIGDVDPLLVDRKLRRHAGRLLSVMPSALVDSILSFKGLQRHGGWKEALDNRDKSE